MQSWRRKVSQITLRHLPENLERQIRRLARENNASINKTIIRLLQKSLGIIPDENKQRDLGDLSGKWSNKAAKEFEENTRIFETIDNEIWMP